MTTTENPFLQWYPGALALARNLLGCEAAARDVTQTAVSKTLASASLPLDDAARRVWFFKVVRNGCLDWLRYERRYDRSVEVNQDVAAEMVDEVEQGERQLWVRRALMRLSSEHREIIVLRDANELSYADIAQILQLNSGTVMSRLHRARMALREQLLTDERMNGGEHEEL